MASYYLTKEACQIRVYKNAKVYAERATADSTILPRLPKSLRWVVMAVLLEDKVAVQKAIEAAIP